MRTRSSTRFSPQHAIIFAYTLPVGATRLNTAHHQRIYIPWYKEEGPTTTPFDICVLNDLDRFHLVMDVIDRVPGLGPKSARLRQLLVDRRVESRAYTRMHGEDPPEIRDWTWTY